MEEQNITVDTEGLNESQQAAWASEAIRNFVADVDTIIAKYPELIEMNFGLFYQNKRLGFIDLDAFAKTVTAKTEIDGEEKTLEEIVDKKEK